MPQACLAGPRLKLSRAEQHLEDLKEKIADFAEHNHCRVVPDTDPHTNEECLGLDLPEPVPQEFALIIGDSVHNLRTSLDFVLSELSRTEGHSDKRIQFPYGTDRERVLERIKKEGVARLGSDVEALIVDEIQPFRNGKGDMLWKMKELDNLDKHRLLVPILEISELRNISMNQGRFRIGSLQIDRIRLEPGARLMLANVSELDHPAEADVSVCFDRGQIFENCEVVATLLQLTRCVASVMGAFEDLIAART